MMNKHFAVLALALFCAICIFEESSSAPQFTGQIGNFQNSTSLGGASGGGAGMSPVGEMQNRTDAYPGVGYPGGYYERHNNETLPTSPSAPSIGGGMNLANTTVPSSGCDCQQMENLSNPTPPGGLPTGGSPAEVPAAAPGPESIGAGSES